MTRDSQWWGTGWPRVRVPASTSNLGPGFDQLGLALAMYLEVGLEGPAEGGQHELILEGGLAREWPREGNCLLQAFDEVMGSREGPPPELEGPHYRFRVGSDIPLGRGLGSSGAATAAGLLLAAGMINRAGGEVVRGRDAAEIGVRLEGHPDNVVASLYGGCTLGVELEAGVLRVIQQELHPDLRVAVVWPSTGLSTVEAREVMPASLSLEDVVWNTRRLSLLLEGLRSGDEEALREGVRDRLHTPFRVGLIRGAREAMQAGSEAGAFCTAISGSGSGLVALHTDKGRLEEVASAMRGELEKHHEWARSRVLAVDREGARLV